MPRKRDRAHLPVIKEETSSPEPTADSKPVDSTPSEEVTIKKAELKQLRPKEAEDVLASEFQEVAKKEGPETMIIRETVYTGYPVDAVNMLGFQIDSNVWVKADGAFRQAADNKHRFVDNSLFEDSWDDDYTVGRVGACEDSAQKIHEWLRYRGKIPEFLEVRYMSKEKGYGVVAMKFIAAGTFLGTYDGLYRPLVINPKNKYVFVVKDFSRRRGGAIDAENMTFANWTRFVNDGAENRTNCGYEPMNYQIFLFAKKDIKPGDEIVASYGEEYWKMFGPKLD